MLKCWISRKNSEYNDLYNIYKEIDFAKEYGKYDLFKLDDKLDFNIIQGDEKYGFHPYCVLHCKLCRSYFDKLYFIRCSNKWPEVLFQELKINVEHFCNKILGYCLDKNFPKTKTLEDLHKIIYALNLYEAYHK